MPEYLHGFSSDHGPVFLFSASPVAPKSVKVIKLTGYFGKTDAGTAGQMSKKIMQKAPGKKIEEKGEKIEFTKEKMAPAPAQPVPMKASVADYVRSVASKMSEKE